MWNKNQLGATKYRVSIKSFPDYRFSKCLPGHVGTLRCNSEEFQLWIIFQQDGAPPHWGSDVRRFLDAEFPKKVDWERWSDTLATTIAGYHPP